MLIAAIAWGLYAAALAYIAVHVIILVGVLRTGRRRLRAAPRSHGFVSVLVAARDEEENIEACLDSLLRQDYGLGEYEVVLVNDRSTDRTREIAERFLSDAGTLVLVDITEDPVGLTGKQNALRVGLAHCRGEYILNTDADCVAPPTWVSRMMAQFADDVGLVIGVPLTYGRGEKASLFARVQALDLAYLLNAAVSAAGWKHPVTCIGNNFAYRRAALREVGGYEGMGRNLTEDGALVNTVHRQTAWRIVTAQEPEAVVITRPTETVRQLYRQRLRWVFGGIQNNKWSIYVLAFLGVCNALVVLTPALAFVPSWRPALGTLIAAKVASDFAASWQGTARIGRRDVLTAFLPFELYYALYTSLLGLAAILTRRVEWKGQIYTRS